MHNNKTKKKDSTSKDRTVLFAQDGASMGTNWMDSLKGLFGSMGGTANTTNAMNIEGYDKARLLNTSINGNLETGLGSSMGGRTTDLTMGDINGNEQLTGKSLGVGVYTAPATPSLPTQQAGFTNTTPTKGTTGVGFGSSGSSIMGGLSSLTGDISNIASVQGNKNLNEDQKHMASADSGVNAVADTASMFGPWGMAIGAGLKLTNSLGGALMGTPDELKNYKTNTAIANSSGYTGLAAQGADLGKSASSYASSGLAGKIAGNSGNLIAKAGAANATQKFAAGVLDKNKLAMDSAAVSTGMLASRNIMKNQNSDMWTNGSVMTGKEGIKLPDIKKMKHQDGGSLQGTQMTLVPKPIVTQPIQPTQSSIPPTLPTPPAVNPSAPVGPLANKTYAPLTPAQMQVWNGYVDYVKSKGLQGSPQLDVRDTNLSKNLYNEYAKTKNFNVPYDQFIPQVQANIKQQRDQIIAAARQGKTIIDGMVDRFGGNKLDIGDEQLNKRFMVGLSQIDGWAGSKTTSYRFNPVHDPTITGVVPGETSRDQDKYKSQVDFTKWGSGNNNGGMTTDTTKTQLGVIPQKELGGQLAANVAVMDAKGGKFNPVNPITHDLITKFLDTKSPWTKKHDIGGSLSISGSSTTKTATKFNYEDGGEIQDRFKKLAYASLKLPVKQIALRAAPFPLQVPTSPENSQPIATFKEGGEINVIVDGALHAHKHEIKDTPEFEDASITHKGIPVITKSEDGDIEQHAEVERDELILHLDLSKRLEELLAEGTDEAAIEAGRLLSKEIVSNTRDSKNKIIRNG